jgi:hypothetical protein
MERRECKQVIAQPQKKPAGQLEGKPFWLTGGKSCYYLVIWHNMICTWLLLVVECRQT